jgi:hypothetical protein
MTSMSVSEMREVEGGLVAELFLWAMFYASALARLQYEHSRYGRCSTNYSWTGFKACPICNKKW